MFIKNQLKYKIKYCVLIQYKLYQSHRTKKTSSICKLFHTCKMFHILGIIHIIHFHNFLYLFTLKKIYLAYDIKFYLIVFAFFRHIRSKGNMQ